MLTRLQLRLAAALVAPAAFAVGAQSAWAAPAAPTNLAVADLSGDEQHYDPQFSWSPVTGATGYEVEINFDSGWASDSKVCCSPVRSTTKRTTFGTLFAPTVVLPNNTYYWRVRAIDANESAGPWKGGSSFTKTYASVEDQSVDNLRLVNSNLSEIAAGSSTATPIVLWDSTPGASSYEVAVTPFEFGNCNWSASPTVRWDSDTSTTGWTPLGWSRAIDADPLETTLQPSNDGITGLVDGSSYCVRVRPVDRASTSNGPVVVGQWTHLPVNNSPAFTWSGPPTAATGDCTSCVMTAGDYLQPGTGTTAPRMPVFTWSPIEGAESYFVVVARDAGFSTIVDYAYTRVRAYAPRLRTQTQGYADETTDYYWAVLPADEATGRRVSAEAASSAARNFVKRSTPPSLLAPADDAQIATAATTFQWTGAEAARRYRIQVAEDPFFANVIQEGFSSTGTVTDASSYTSNTAYPTGKTLYWRVQAQAEDGLAYVGLAWSDTGTFVKKAGSNPSTALQRFYLFAKGYPVHKRYRSVTLTVRNRANGSVVPGATVHVSGARVGTKTKKTGTDGKVTFRLRARRYPGKVTYRVSKTGFTTAYIYQSVRLG
jgi:hypothetical protein